MDHRSRYQSWGDPLKRIIALALILAPLNAFAEEMPFASASAVSSGDMQQLCQQNSLPCEIFIDAIAMGVTGGLVISDAYFERSDALDTDEYIDVVNQKLFGCVPDDLSHRQHYEVWMKFLDNHPDRLGEDAVFTLWDASVAAFPCN